MKKIMIALLAIAVLFGFAACDNSNSGSASADDQRVVALTIDGPTEYFAGETVDLSKYTVTATRNDNSTFVVEDVRYLDFDADTTNQDTYVTTGLKANASESEQTIGTIRYTGPFFVAGVTAEVKATVYTLDAIDVAVSAEQPVYYEGSDVKNLNDDYTVTAYALGADNKTVLYSRPLDSDEFVIVDTGASNAAVTAVTAKSYTLGFACFADPADSTFTPASETIEGGKNEATLVVRTDSVSSFTVEAVANDETTAGVAYPVAGKTTIGTAPEKYIVISYEMASGRSGKLIGTNSNSVATFAVSWGTGVTTTGQFGAEGTQYPITVTPSVGADAQTYQLKSVADTIKSFEVEAASTLTAIAPGDTLENTDFVVKPTWLSTTSAATEDKSLVSALKLNNGTTYEVPEDYPATGATLPITFTLDGYPNATTKSSFATGDQS